MTLGEIIILASARLGEKNNMNADELLQAGQYAAAIKMRRDELANDPGNIYIKNGLSTALYANGNYIEAIPLLIESGNRSRADRSTPGSPGNDLKISIAYWCLGNRDEAIRLMKGLCWGILDGTIQYASSTGGGEQGLLLHYMATTTQDDVLRQYAFDYMKKVIKQQAKYLPHMQILDLGWPIPLMAFVLGESPYAQVMKFATSSRMHTKETTEDAAEAREIANTDLMTRRRLTNVYLQEATLARARGDEEGCMAKMRECYELENPIIEAAWYLARYEVTGK
jgi:tetratricopeptide (TPR) repeat protein